MACSFPLSSNYAKSAPRATEVAEIYKINGHPTIGGTKTGGLVKYFLICSNTFWHRQPY